MHAAVASLRVQALELLEVAVHGGLSAEPLSLDLVSRLQRVTSDLHEILTTLEPPPDAGAGLLDAMTPQPSRDAAAVLGLASAVMSLSRSSADEAERWLRVLRLHGRVAAALRELGVPEAPLGTVADEPDAFGGSTAAGMAAVATVAAEASGLARRTGSPTVDTIHLLFALRARYGGSFDRALYRRGVSWDGLLERLPDAVSVDASA